MLFLDINFNKQNKIVSVGYGYTIYSITQKQETLTQIGSVCGTISGTSTAMAQLGAGIYGINPTCPRCGSRVGSHISCPNCGTSIL